MELCSCGGAKGKSGREAGMSEGVVKWFNPVNGYGCITQEEGKAVFGHFSSIDGEGYKTLEAGERVVFEVSEGPKGPMAVNVAPQA